MKDLKIARRGDKIKIIHQSYRDSRFSPLAQDPDYPHVFQSKDGFILCSLSEPLITPSIDGVSGYINHKGRELPGLFVMGSDPSKDHRIMEIPDELWVDQLKSAVREYNDSSEGRS